MPVLPALAAVIGVGFQCTLQADYDTGHHNYVCTEHTNIWNTATWSTALGSLPEDIQNDLEEYDPKLAIHLADYSNFCQGDQRVFTNVPSVFEEDIGRIFCPLEYHRCDRWKDRGGCLKARCRHKYTLYAMISRGIYKMHIGCLRNKISPEWNEVINQYIISSDRTNRQRLQRERSPIDP